jgi:hypothetical protein
VEKQKKTKSEAMSVHKNFLAVGETEQKVKKNGNCFSGSK